MEGEGAVGAGGESSAGVTALRERRGVLARPGDVAAASSIGDSVLRVETERLVFMLLQFF